MNSAAHEVLRLQPELTIYGAADLHALLLAGFGRSGALVLELDDVCEVDTAGVQLLLAARRTALARGVHLQLRGHSPAVLEAFALLGLNLGLDPDLNPEGERHDA